MPKFSERLLALRKERHLKQEDIAEKFGISVRTYRRYETEVSDKITLETLWKIADFYEVSVDYLIGRSEER